MRVLTGEQAAIYIILDGDRGGGRGRGRAGPGGIPVAKYLTHADKVSGGAIKDILIQAAAKGTEGVVQTLVAEIGSVLLKQDIAVFDRETNQYTLVDNGENKDLIKQLGAQFSAEALVEFVSSLVAGR